VGSHGDGQAAVSCEQFLMTKDGWFGLAEDFMKLLMSLLVDNVLRCEKSKFADFIMLSPYTPSA